MERLAGRYELVAEVTRGRGRTLWQGHDVVLDRAVGILLLERHHPQAAAVRDAAAAAARVEHAGLLRVIDADVDDDRVVVVTRWLPGRTLADRLASGPLRPAQAATVVGQIAEALAEAAADGVHHLVLDPRDVVLTDHGAVLVGAGVRAALEGVPVEADAEAVDAWRLGALLYAAITGRWPGHPCAGLPAAPTVNGRVARPRQVRAGVPTRLDDVVWRCLDPEAPEPLATPAAVAEALSATGPDPEAPELSTWSTAGWPWIRMGLATVGAVVLAGAVLFGLQVWQDATRAEPSPKATTTSTATTSPSPTGSTPDDGLAPVAIVSARAFDPAGDGEENDELAAAAVDGDPTTAWQTVTYATRDLGQLKPGVGLLLDLGLATGVSGVELELVGRGTDLQVLASDRAAVAAGAANPTRGFEVIGAVRGAGDRVTLRTVEPVSARWVLVWLTALPVATDGYRGGIAEVVVLR